MIIKHRKSSVPIYLVLAILIFMLLFMVRSKNFIHDGFNEFKQILQSLDLGFTINSLMRDMSSDGQFISYPSGTSRVVGISLGVMNKIPAVIERKIFGYTGEEEAERIDVAVDFKSYQKILDDRRRALDHGLLVAPVMVKGRVFFRGKEFKANIRLKGDLVDHWAHKNGMSLRINLKGDNTILGFKRFSIQKPEVRGFPDDLIFHEVLKKAGNLTSVHTFADVFFNGDRWGKMNIEEAMSNEFLEKQKVKESIIVRFSDERGWDYMKRGGKWYQSYLLSDPYLNTKVYRGKKSLTNPLFRKFYSYIVEKRNDQQYSHLYDVDSYSRLFFSGLIWGESHALMQNNMRHYFNPYSLQLEPIATDQYEYARLIPGRFPFKASEYPNSIDHNYNKWWIEEPFYQVSRTKKYRDNFDDNFGSVLDAVKNIQEVSEDLTIKYFPLNEILNTTIIKDNAKDVVAMKEQLYSPFANLPHQVDLNLIPPTQEQSALFNEHVHAKHFEDGTIEFYNLLPDEVKINAVFFDGKIVPVQINTIPGYRQKTPIRYVPTAVSSGLTGLLDGRLSIETEYNGTVGYSTVAPTLVKTGLQNPLVRETLDTLPYLSKLPNGDWEILSGEWFIDSPITIHGNLHILPGTKLNFSENAYLIVDGALTAKGEYDNEIVLQSAISSWKGIYVIGGKNKSLLQYVTIRDTQSLDDGLLKLTGGVTFYRTQVDIKNVVFDGSGAEDALNIVDSKFDLNEVSFEKIRSDGFDSDHSVGSITDSKFIKIGGDALDFSGSTASIKECLFDEIHDKAVSVGERSNVEIDKSEFAEVGVGIASKDGSEVVATNLLINSYRLSAGMTYIKKDYFGSSASLKLFNSRVKLDGGFTREIGTYLSVDGVEVREDRVDVKKLYQGGVMSKRKVAN